MTDTESKPSPTMEELEAILHEIRYGSGPPREADEVCGDLRTLFQALLSENAELRRRMEKLTGEKR